MRRYYRVKREGFWLRGLFEDLPTANEMALGCVERGASVAHVFQVAMPCLESSHAFHCATGGFPEPTVIGGYVSIFNQTSLSH